MKILIISPTIYEFPNRVGGAETYVDSLAAALASQEGIKVGLIGFSDGGARTFEKNQVAYKIFKSRPIKNNPSNPWPIFNFFEMRKWDIIYLQQFHTWLTFFCIIIAKIFNKKIILTDHNGGGPTLNRKLRLDEFIDIFFATSLLSAKENNLKAKKITPIYGGVDLKLFRPSDKPRSGILFVGRAHKIKGILPFLQQALEQNYKDKITLALGVNYDNVEYYSVIKRFIEENHLTNVIVEKNLNKDELVKRYQSHLWTVLPSIDEIPHESLGMTVLESLACGTPAALSLFCGITELFLDKNYAFIHIMKDSEKFFKEISKTQPEGSREWCEKNADWNNIAKTILKNINER